MAMKLWLLCGASQLLTMAHALGMLASRPSSSRLKNRQTALSVQRGGAAASATENADLRQQQPTPTEDFVAGDSRQFQCASEYDYPTYGCKTCTMSNVCACDGIVRIGYGSRWSPFINATASSPVTCNADSFGTDPFPGHGKICQCRPKVFTCASEYSKPVAGCDECKGSKQCRCTGFARMGYGTTWSPWISTIGSVQCSVGTFGDAVPGQGKICQCQPLDLLAGGPMTPPAPGSLPSNTILKSVLGVTLTYFVVYIVLASVRTYNQLTRPHLGPSPFENVIQCAATSCVYFAPTLCAIFLAASKRADVLSGGAPWAYGLPPYWLKCCILLSSVCFALQTLAYIVAEWFVLSQMGRAANREAAFGQSGDMEIPRAAGGPVKRWRQICNAATIAMYVSLGFVILGIVGMEEPDELVASSGVFPASSGTVCTLTLSIAYMLVYLALHMFRVKQTSANDQGEVGPAFGLEVLKLTATAMNFAPMLCILFISTQTAVDWSGNELPSNVTKWMYICTASVLLQAVLVALAPMLAGAELQVVGNKGEVDFVTHSNDVFVLLSIIRWAAMIAMYFGVGVMCFTLRSVGEGWPAVRAVDRFALLYFTTYLALWLAITLRQVARGGYDRVIKILSVAKDTVVFCPMLAALFFESFVQAHGILNMQGEAGQPQAYAQDAMAVAFAALTLQLIMILCAGFASPLRQAAGAKQAAQPMFLLGFHIAMGVLYVSVASVAFGLFTISPSNASGAGAWFA